MKKLLPALAMTLFIFGCATSHVQNESSKSTRYARLAELVTKCNFCAGYNGPGGPCDKGAGGAISAQPGGYCFAGPGGPLFTGPGGALSTSPGGTCATHPGGNCSKSPGSDGKNCPLACRLNK